MKSEQEIIHMIIKEVIKKQNILKTSNYTEKDLKEYDDKIEILMSVFKRGEKNE